MVADTIARDGIVRSAIERGNLRKSGQKGVVPQRQKNVNFSSFPHISSPGFSHDGTFVFILLNIVVEMNKLNTVLIIRCRRKQC